MRFALSKYTLTHFIRRRGINWQVLARLQGVTIEPKLVVRILGLQLDSKLRWKAHEQATQAKMKTQVLALQRTTASTWGASMLKARHVYQAVVRSALSYRAALWHQPTSNVTKAKGPAARLRV